MSKRKKNLEKVIQQCQKTLDKIDEELAKPEPKFDSLWYRNGKLWWGSKRYFKDSKEEIKIMMEVLDKNEYMPDYTYP